MTHTSQDSAPDALLLLGTHCPHCPNVLKALGELVKTGKIGRLEVVNLERRPDVAETLGVRSVPWVRIGVFELEGLRSQTELEQWASRAGTPEGMVEYIGELLGGGELDKTAKLIPKDERVLDAMMRLLADPDTELQVRVGIGAIMEDLEGSRTLKGLVKPLGTLTGDGDPRIRLDACHYLGLSHAAEAVPYVTPLLQDPDPDVREVAKESLAVLKTAENS